MTWQHTKSGAWLGYVSGATIIPALILGPFGGLLANRTGHLRAIRISQTSYIISLTVLGLALMTQTVTIEILFTCAIVHGFIGAIFIPTEFAFLRTLANNRRLIATITVFETFKGIGKFMGPILAAYLITSAREYVVIGAIGAHALCLIGLSHIRTEPLHRPKLTCQYYHALGISETLKYFGRNPVFVVLLALYALTLFETLTIWTAYLERSGEGPTLYQNYAAIQVVLSLLIGMPLVLWIASRGSFHIVPKCIAQLFPVICLSIIFSLIAYNLPGTHLILLATLLATLF